MNSPRGRLWPGVTPRPRAGRATFARAVEFHDAYATLLAAVTDAPEAEGQPEGYVFRYADRTAGTHYWDHLPDLQRLVRPALDR